MFGKLQFMPLCQVTIRIFPIFEVVCGIKELFHQPKNVIKSKNIKFGQHESKCKDNGICCSRTIIDKSDRNWEWIERGVYIDVYLIYIYYMYKMFFQVLFFIFRELKNLLKKYLKQILAIVMQWDKSQLHSYVR